MTMSAVFRSHPLLTERQRLFLNVTIAANDAGNALAVAMPAASFWVVSARHPERYLGHAQFASRYCFVIPRRAIAFESGTAALQAMFHWNDCYYRQAPVRMVCHEDVTDPNALRLDALVNERLRLLDPAKKPVPKSPRFFTLEDMDAYF